MGDHQNKEEGAANTSTFGIIRCNNSSEEDDERYFRSLPDGIRFRPKDEELVVKYLKREVEKKKPLPRNKIRRIDIYNHTPQQLCQRDEDHRENEWYFFSPRDRKYPNGSRPKRQAVGGFWKPTGIDTAVVHKGSVVGYKKTLDFYEGHYQKKPTRINWKMHEYRIHRHPQPVTKTQNTATPNNMELDTVLCKIYRNEKAKKEDKNDDIVDQNSCRHFNDEQQQPQPPQLQTVAAPYNSYGGARAQSISIDDIPTISATDNFVFIHENGGEEDGTLRQNSVESAGEDYYYSPSGSLRYEGFDELSSVFGGRRLHYGADKNT